MTLEPPTWSDTSGRILEDPTVQQTLATYLVDQIYSNVDVAGQIRQALPERFKPLAGPAAAGLHDSAERITVRALANPRVQQALARRQQAGRPPAREGDRWRHRPDEHERRRRDARSAPAALQIAGRLGLADRVSSALPPGAGRIEILRAKQLDLAQKVARGLKIVATFLVLAVLVIFGHRDLDRTRPPASGAGHAQSG